MSGKILVVWPDSTQVVLDQVVAADEAALHDQLKRTPALLPVEAFGLEGPMLVVGHETSLASGRIDLVGVVRSGDVLLIEFKIGAEP